MTAPIAGLPAGAGQRLTDHYGSDVRGWLRAAPGVVAEVADAWGVHVSGYHDAEWTSVIAAGRDHADRPVIVKVLPETERYHQERAALEHWAGAGVCRLLNADDGAQALLIESVTTTPGGAPRPPDHALRVAGAINRLHEKNASLPAHGAIPLLTRYYAETVIPRVLRRADQWGDTVGPSRVARAIELCRDLCADRPTPSVLHSDLYAENVLFTERGEPVFIDPHAKIGSAAFDWAFWTVYYEPTKGFAERLDLCRQHAPCDVAEVLAWVVTLAVDGALYYLDTEDATAQAMLAVLDAPALAPLLGAGTP